MATQRLAAILKISVLLYSPIGEYNSSICRICYVHLCKNTNYECSDEGNSSPRSYTSEQKIALEIAAKNAKCDL
jgi:hypothetical protein